MAFFSRIVSIFLLTYVLLNSRGNARHFFLFDLNEYRDLNNPCGQYLATNFPPASGIASNDTIPCNNGSSLAGGNALYLVFDPITQSFSTRVSPPCNVTINSTQPSGGNNSSPSGNSTSPFSPETDVCTVISLITQILDAVVNLSNQFLQNLMCTELNLVRNLLGSVVTPFLDILHPDIEALLNNTLLTSLDGVEILVNTTLGGLLGNDSLVPTLLTNVEELLGSQLGDILPPDQLDNVTDSVTQLLNNTFLGLLNDAKQLVQNLLDPTSTQASLPGLTQNVTTLLSSTLQDLLDDVDELVQDLLDGSLDNQSVTMNLTRDAEVLLTDVLNDTICDLQILLNDTDSLSKLVNDLGKLLENLLGDVQQDTIIALTNLLQSVLNQPRLLDQLLEDLFKLLIDSLTNSLGQKISVARSMMDPNFKNQMMQNLTSILNDSLPITPTIPTSFRPQILQLVENLLDEILGNVDELVSGVSGKNNTLITGPVNNLLQGVEQLLQNLRQGLLGGLQSSMNSTISNGTSGIIDLPVITSPLGMMVANILNRNIRTIDNYH